MNGVGVYERCGHIYVYVCMNNVDIYMNSVYICEWCWCI